jgi:hypothetical protein
MFSYLNSPAIEVVGIESTETPYQRNSGCGKFPELHDYFNGTGT